MGKDNFMAKPDKELIYKCIDPQTIKEISNMYKEYKISEHIEALYSLIMYQLKEIQQCRASEIADRHMIAWKQYDDITLKNARNR